MQPIPILTIILGKNVAQTFGLDTKISAALLFYPEVRKIKTPMGIMPVALHPDDYVPQAITWIREMAGQNRENIELWTLSEYMVSAVAVMVQKNWPFWKDKVEVQLYADDNKSFKTYGISEEGYLCDDGWGGRWPIGWFLPSM
jgi:hypothetical protein